MGSISIPRGANDVFVEGEHAYVTSSKVGVHVIDVTDPQAMREVDQFEVVGTAIPVVAEDRHVYVGDLGVGLWVLKGPAHR